MDRNTPDTPACFAQHMGLWAIEPSWMQRALAALTLRQYALVPARAFTEQSIEAAMPRRESELFVRAPGEVALIRVDGPIFKWPSAKFGGTSTKYTQRAMQQALDAPDIGSILLSIDSPGGQVSGVEDLAQTIADAAQVKPVAAHIEDLGASAAYWIASQAQRITASPASQVGSIGAFAVLEDTSGLAQREGVRIVVKSTGPYKGLGVPGTPITAEAEDEVQRMVDAIGQFFFTAVQRGRRLGAERMRAVTTGQVWMAAEAQALGLLDGVERFDAALAAAAQLRPRRAGRSQQRAAQLAILAATAAQREVVDA